jgi:hypothetical protein
VSVMTKLTGNEKRAIQELRNLAKRRPKTLVLFAYGSLTVRKPKPDGSYFAETVAADIGRPPNDGGDFGPAD